MIDKTVFENKIAAYYTLGCKLNFAETSTIGKVLAEQGVRKARPGEKADICVVNTCSVTELADKKCRQAIRRIGKQHPGAFIVVTGCYAQLKPEEVSHIEGVDLVLGAEQKLDLLMYLDDLKKREEGGAIIASRTKDIRTFSPSCSADDRTRHFLKVQDGCDYFCSYCTIPFARGRSRNGTIASMVKQAEEVASNGGKEIVLTGVNIGDFGKSTGETFIDLIRALDKVEGIVRYRISSIEPNLLTDEIIAFCAASPKFQHHFHIPLQSGSDKILGLMRRRYTTARFADRIAAVRALMPDAFIGIDVIVGFPGETEEDFRTTYDFLAGLEPAFLHIFPFSERPGTPAVEMPGKVQASVATRRAAELEALCAKLHGAFCARAVGSEDSVLFESTRRGGMMFGFTGNYRRVKAPYDKARVNTVCRVRLGAMDESHDLMGEIRD
mgnify:FL=1